MNAHKAFEGTEICCLRASRMKKFYVEFLWRHFNFNQFESFFVQIFNYLKFYRIKMYWKIIQKKIFFFSVSKTSGNAWKIGHITHHLENNQVSETPWHMLSHCEIAKLLVLCYCHSGIDAHHQHWIVFLKQFFFSFFDAKKNIFLLLFQCNLLLMLVHRSCCLLSNCLSTCLCIYRQLSLTML